MNAQQRRDEDSPPTPEASTLAGTIRWFALAIGVACLALLTLVGSLAHAAGTTDAAALKALEQAQVTAMPANANTSIDHRGGQSRPKGARTARAVAGPHG